MHLRNLCLATAAILSLTSAAGAYPAVDTATSQSLVSISATAGKPLLLLARRGADDPAGHNRGDGRGRGGKGRGGHDDGPGHA